MQPPAIPVRDPHARGHLLLMHIQRALARDYHFHTKEVRQFKTTTAGLLVLADWLKAHQISDVVMEATGDYWKPVWCILEGDFKLMLVNARDVKNLPGRKTDVKDDARACAGRRHRHHRERRHRRDARSPWP